MHQHVLGGRLWYKECQDANQDLPHQLPLNYDSPDHYVSTFEPMLFEEAREAVRSTWLESCDMKKTFTVDITRCGRQAYTCITSAQMSVTECVTCQAHGRAWVFICCPQMQLC